MANSLGLLQKSSFKVNISSSFTEIVFIQISVFLFEISIFITQIYPFLIEISVLLIEISVLIIFVLKG
jgi:hypothetical protein